MTTSSAPFYAVELVAVLPGTGGVPSLPTWNVVAWNTLTLTPVAIQSTATILASDVGYRTLSTDPNGVQSYPPVLVEAFAIDRVVPLAPGDTSAAYAWGSIQFSNDDGRFDGIAASWNADRRAATIWRGTKTWDATRGIFTDPAYGSLSNVFTGIAQPWFLSDTALQVPLRDATYWLETPLQSTLYLGSGTYEGTADLTGKPKPKTRGGTAGHPVCNVTPVLIDPTNRIYQYNDAAGTVVNLYEGGATTIVFSSDTANLYSGSTTAGHYRTDNSRGLFQLGSTPVYTITADVTGQFPTAGVKTNAALIAQYIMSEDLALPAGNLDTSSFTTAAGNYAYVAGVYFSPDDSPDGATAVSRVLEGFAAKLIPNRTGKLKCLVLRALAGTETPVATFDSTNLVSLTPIQLPASITPPPYRIRCSYNHNYTVQTSGLNTASATATQVQFVASPDRYAYYINNTTLTSYARPNDLAPFGGSLLISTDAQTVANDMGTLWGVRRRLYSAVLPLSVGVQRDIGDVVLLNYPMDDLRTGRLGQIVGETLRSGDDTITLQVLV